MAHPLPSSGIAPGTGPVFNTLSQEVIDVVLKELNNFFAGYQAVKDFQTATDVGDPTTEIFEQKLFISYQSPEDDRFLPALIVKCGNFREYRMDLGNKWESNTQTGTVRYGGSVTADINIIVASVSTQDMDRLVDYLQLAFFLIKAPDLQSQGVLLAPNGLSVSDMGAVPYDQNKSIQRKMITQEVWLQWFFDYKPSAPTVTNVVFRLAQPIQGIKITETQ